jgi:hypothetical protein
MTGTPFPTSLSVYACHPNLLLVAAGSDVWRIYRIINGIR